MLPPEILFVTFYLRGSEFFRSNNARIGGIMKSCSLLTIQTIKTVVIVFAFFCSSLAAHGDIEFSGGITAEIDYLVEGSVLIYDANVALYNPAHITGGVLCDSRSTLDVYGGQIDFMLLVSTSGIDLPDAQVTIYGTDFALDGEPLTPDTTELYIPYQKLSGTYFDGTPFSFYVDCYLTGGPGGIFYFQTIKLGWIVSQPDIEVSESNYHFGQMDIGSTHSEVIPIFNLGDAPLTIESLQLEQSQLAQFEMSSWQPLPVTLEPNSFIDLDIQFSPVIEGVETGVLTIVSNDPNDPVVDVLLTGEGMSVVLSSEEQITQILDVFDGAIEEGSIQGVGNEKSATNKVEVFGKILSLADELLQADYDEYALETLLMIEKKCDGQKAPKDFIEGAAAEELNTLINALIDILQQ
jgi:hypothetical protein